MRETEKLTKLTSHRAGSCHIDISACESVATCSPRITSRKRKRTSQREASMTCSCPRDANTVSYEGDQLSALARACGVWWSSAPTQPWASGYAAPAAATAPAQATRGPACRPPHPRAGCAASARARPLRPGLCASRCQPRGSARPPRTGGAGPAARTPATGGQGEGALDGVGHRQRRARQPRCVPRAKAGMRRSQERAMQRGGHLVDAEGAGLFADRERGAVHEGPQIHVQLTQCFVQRVAQAARPGQRHRTQP